MKKLISFILALIAMFIGINIVEADIISFEDVVNKMKSPFSYELDGMEEIYQEFEEHVTYTSTDNTLKVAYSDSTEGIEHEALFTFEDGIISYSYAGDKTSEAADASSMVDAIIISKLLFVVFDLNGYDLETIVNFDFDETKLTLKDNGIEVTMFKVSGEGFEIEAYDTFKIDINNINLPEIEEIDEDEDIIDVGITEDEEVIPTGIPEELPENPSTGAYISTVVISVLAVIAISIGLIVRKHNVINKI